MSFHVGQKVVCIKDSPGPEIARWASKPVGQKSDRITVGDVYVIREIDTRALELHGTATLRFEGILIKPRASTVGDWEPGFPATYFRPLIERKATTETGMSILRKVAADAAKRRNLVVTR